MPSLLRDGAALMPATMRATTGRIVEHDWFGHYAELENVGRALDRIAARVRFANRFDGAIEDIERHHDRLEAVFLALYPALREHVDEQALEAPPADDGGVTAG